MDVELFLNDRRIDLISEGFELAIRAGNLSDSSLIAKKLGEVYFALFASPAYLKKVGAPEAPQDLRGHVCLPFSSIGIEEWNLVGPKSVVVPMKKQVVVNHLDVIRDLTQAGMGVALMPTFICHDEVRSGKLVRILPD